MELAGFWGAEIGAAAPGNGAHKAHCHLALRWVQRLHTRHLQPKQEHRPSWFTPGTGV